MSSWVWRKLLKLREDTKPHIFLQFGVDGLLILGSARRGFVKLRRCFG
ncbi:unnamed protein product [Arabidopsis halleri]